MSTAEAIEVLDRRRANKREYMRRRRAADPDGERAKLQAWCRENVERRRDASRRSKLKHREMVLAKKRLASRIWRTENKERTRAYQARRWREATPEKKAQLRLVRTAAMRKWRTQDPKRARAVRAEWARRNPEREREHDHRYRARKAAAFVAPVTEACLLTLLASQGGGCHYCGEPLDKKKHLDHKTPLSRGGTHEPGNVCWACPPCNVGKKDKTESEYFAYRRQCA